jgi:ankyrin repeat protein
VKLPMIRNFIVGYCWFILIIMHTVYSAVPLAMLYFKARQAAGETLDAATTNHLQQAETEKLADKMTKASIAWFVTPFIMLAILIGSSFLGSISGASLIDDTRNGNQANVKRKLANGASPNETRFGGTTVLMFAAKDGQAEIVKELLKAGGKLEQQDDDGDTPLIYAAIDNRAEVLQILLEAGAKVNVRNKEGKTAAMYAAQRGRIETLKLLLANGADLTIKDNKGKSALMYAEEAEQTQTLQLLKAANAND